MVRWRHSKTGNCLHNLVKIREGRKLRAAKKLSRNCEGSSINSLKDGEASIILGNRSQTQKNQRQVEEPVGASQPGM